MQDKEQVRVQYVALKSILKYNMFTEHITRMKYATSLY
jgi:hypothetical protein